MRPAEELRGRVLARLLAEMRLLRERPLFRSDLAALLTISERQVQRDIEVMRLAGVRIARHRDGYHIVGCPIDGGTCPPARLSAPSPSPQPRSPTSAHTHARA